MNERSQLGKAGGGLWGAIRDNPEGLLLLAAGGILLMRKSIPSSIGAGKRVAHAHDGDRGSKTPDLTDQVASAAESIGAFTSNYAREAGRTASEGSAYVVRQAQTGLDRVLHDQPLIVALAGLAAGAAVAAVLPSSDFEKQTLGPLGEQISDEAARVGDQFKDTASKAAGTLKAAVHEHGLDPDGLKKIASEVTGVIRDSVAGESQRVAGESQRPGAKLDTSARPGGRGE
jgi:hypothetical protein